MFPHFEENSIKTKPERKKKIINHFRRDQTAVIMVTRVALMENTGKRGEDLS